ncbi:MAG: pinensin family lanthipeptide [Luteibaculum sp.]
MKKKLSIKEIQVKSFVTKLNEQERFLGGAGTLKQCSIVFCSQIDACITARGCTIGP